MNRFLHHSLFSCAVAAVLGVLTPFAFAPYYQFWLMPLLFTALILLGEHANQRRTRLAYCFGIAGYTAQFWWIHTALHDVSGLPNLYAVPLTFLLPAFLALFPAAAFYLYGKTRLPKPIAICIALPVFWTLGEFARERVLTGFGWGALGYSQISDYSPLAGFTPVGGIHLTTFATALCAAWLALLLHPKAAGIRTRVVCVFALLAVLSGGHLLRQTEFTLPTGKSSSVALLQGNIPQQLKFDPAAREMSYRRYYDQVAGSRADIVILPETAFPDLLQHIEPALLHAFAHKARENGSELAVGIPAFTRTGDAYLNAVVHLSKLPEHAAPQQIDALPLYAKNHLVPFGEYKPLPTITEPLYRLMNMPLADFQRGGAAQQPFHMAGQDIAFNICYEDGFGDELIASAKQATLLANVSNMAWYGDSNAMWQQLQQSQARALELGRYMVRATNTGATAVMSPQGKIIAQAAPNTASVLESRVAGMTGDTPYMKLGGSLPLIALLALGGALLLCWRKKI